MKNKKIYKIVVASSLALLLLDASIIKIVFSKHSYMGGIQKVTFFSQSPTYKDKGFNELTYDGANEYATSEKEMVGNTATASYSDDGSSYVHELSNIYDLGADTIISSGFNVAGSFAGVPGKPKDGGFKGLYDEGYDDKKVVMVDDNSLSAINQNAISINFKSQDAGFIAGVVASVYTTYAAEVFNLNPSAAVWGGLAYSTVFDWLSGLEQGINWFNYQILGFDLDGNPLDSSLTVDKISDLKDNSADTLNLHGTTLNGHKIIDEKIAINNAGNIIVDYSTPPDEGSNDGVNFDAETSFYTGGFGFDPNDQASGSNAAIKIKKINSDSGKDSIVFPVAGGQTMETLANLSDGSKTMAMGVDSDAEAASPNYGDNILGSATKNIVRAANFGTWYSQNKESTIEEQIAYNDGTMSAKEFIDTWTPKEGYDDISGTQFVGTFKNKGVGFEDNGSNKIGKLLGCYGIYENKDSTKIITTKYFLENIMPSIFKMNNNVIEDASETFAIQTLPSEHLTKKMIDTYPWIPNWNKYHN